MLEDNVLYYHILVTIHVFTIKSKETKYFSINFGACTTTTGEKEKKKKPHTPDMSENTPEIQTLNFYSREDLILLD